MTTDTRPLSERVADILATEDCVVTPLLREAMSELADRDAQIEMRGNMIWQLEGYIDGFKTQLEALGAEVRALREERDLLVINYANDGVLAQNERDRAWQALRDWCDGTPEQWQKRVDAAPRISVNGGSQVSIGGVVMIDVEGRR